VVVGGVTARTGRGRQDSGSGRDDSGSDSG